MLTKKDLDRFWDLRKTSPIACESLNPWFDSISKFVQIWSSDGRIGDSSTNTRDGKTAEAGIIRDLDAIACIESAKSDITYNDSYVVSSLNFAAYHNNFIDNNVN